SELSVELEHLRFNDVNFYFLNEYKNLDLDINAEKVILSGNFSSDEFTLNTEAILLVNQINSEGKSMMKNKYVYVDTDLAVNQKTKIYKINRGQLSFQDLKFKLTGNIKNRVEGVTLDIKTTGDEMGINKLFSLFPEEQREKLNAYKTDGIITYNSTIKGDLSAKKTPSFNADFSISQGSVIEKSSDQALTNIILNGTFTNGENQSSKSSKLILKEVEANFGAGKITGNYTISDFNNPYIVFNTIANVDITTAKEFFKWDTLSTATGNLELSLTYSGYIKELNDIKASELQKLNASGSARLSNASFQLENTEKSFKNINGAFKFNNNDIQVDTLNFNSNNSYFELDGKFKNLLAFLFIEGENLAIKTNFHSNKLVLDDFLSAEEGSSEYSLKLPKNISLNFRAKVDTFQFRKFNATNFKGHVELDDQILTVTNFAFNSMEGEIKGNVAIDDSKGEQILITSKAYLTNVNIEQLFYQFENFGQTHILDKNLKGKTTTRIEFASVWDKQLNADKDKIYVLADINISDGELIDYKPILAMSKYIEVEELEHIKFDKLTTQIEVQNQIVNLPKTDINSSAIDLTISGKHKFNNEIDYRFKLLLNDVLWRKAKDKKKENTEFGYVADDGLGKTTLFLKMTGTVDDYKIAYDTEGLKESWKEDLKEEKQTLKSILNKEFGWFKKDSTLKKDDTAKDDGFQIEWEEDDDDQKKTETKTEAKKKKTKKKKKGLGKFIDKIAQPEDEEYEEFDDI
ncbi:MAG: AsmA-like C-terminal region-containing protein, partial [Vicingaceae bacterium]|nr:AsmA-like C-terminal region-containing protein [Vicingaceae bacterium]